LSQFTVLVCRSLHKVDLLIWLLCHDFIFI
jgi:hypothetical protein